MSRASAGASALQNLAAPLRYYTRHGDHNLSGAQPGHSDGYSFYRSIARTYIGDPDLWHSVRAGVLQFVAYVLAHQQHPLHDRFAALESGFRNEANSSFLQHNALFAHLDCPDLFPTLELFEIVAHALKIRLQIFNDLSAGGEAQGLGYEVGADGAPPCTLLLSQGNPYMAVVFSTLVPDETGKALVEYLQMTQAELDRDQNKQSSERRLHGLRMEQITYTWSISQKLDGTTETAMKTYNGFRNRDELRSPDLGKTPNRMDVYNMAISDPRQVAFGVDLLLETLKRAPCQQTQIKVGTDCKAGYLRPHLAIDLEHVKYPRHKVVGKTSAEIARLVQSGEVEELCSVLAFGVGEHFCVEFNLAYMLEHINEYTAGALDYLFENTIFNTGIMKIGWNPQMDAIVLDHTVAQMYQRTAREPYQHQPNPASGETHYVYPRFHFHSDRLQRVRPKSMEFPRIPEADQKCDMHKPDLNRLGMSCLCSLGYVDIAAFINLLCRQQGLNAPKRGFTECRAGFKYGAFLNLMLRNHRLLQPFEYMKSCGEKSGTSQLDFYQSLGLPGTETNDLIKLYGNGDVLGINVIFEQLLNDDKVLVGSMLLDYAHGEPISPTFRRIIPQGPSALGYCGGIPLFDHNPKTFQHHRFAESTKSKQVFDELLTSATLFQTSSLSFFEREERVRLARKLYAPGSTADPLPQKVIYELPTNKELSRMDERKRTLLKQITDPTKKWVPSVCATLIPEQHPGLIVRAGATYAESLVSFLESAKAAGASPPTGFGAPPGFPDGLPPWLNIVPGACIPSARNIFNAYQVNNTHWDGSLLGGPANLYRRRVTIKPDDLRAKEKAAAAIKKNAVYELHQDIKTEKFLNAEHGLPGIIDRTDVWDPEGREYRRMMEATPHWNWPTSFAPMAGPGGEWKSVATVTLEAVEEQMWAQDAGYANAYLSRMGGLR